MKNWIAERLINFGDWVLNLGLNFRTFEEHWDFCDGNDDCLCNDPECIEIRNGLSIQDIYRKLRR